MSAAVELTAGYRLAPGVVIRQENFGGLVYRYDNRRLYFLYSHPVVEFVQGLDGKRPLQEALDSFLAAWVRSPSTTREALIKVVAQLERLGILTYEA